MTFISRTLAAALVAAAGFGTAASAAVIDLSTLVGWDVQDQFMNLGDFYTNSYYAPYAIKVKFTDLFVQGDSYSIHINGVFQYNTTYPALDGTFITDPDTAYASGKYSSGIINLAAGDTLAFDAFTIPAGYSDGTLAVSAVAVPEPATWALMIAGFGMVGYAMRRRSGYATA